MLTVPSLNFYLFPLTANGNINKLHLLVFQVSERKTFSIIFRFDGCNHVFIT